MQTVVIRFSSLGDIVLCGFVTGQLEPVTFVTSPRYRELAQVLPGVTKVICPPEDPLPKKASKIIDLHANPRSNWTAAKIKGPVKTVKRYDFLRRMRVAFKWQKKPPLVVQRYAAAADVDVDLRPWLHTEGEKEQLVLCPFAQHATKCWPAENYVSLARQWDGRVLLLGGITERKQLRKMVDQIGTKASYIAEQGFVKTLAALGNGKIAVGGDTGLMHLCAVSGMPVVMLFGPTTSTDGFWCHQGVVVEQQMFCRPCARHGGPRCPIGDHLCLRSITVSAVQKAIGEML